MIIHIKQLILESGVVDFVQKDLKNSLNIQLNRGKEIDRITAGEIQNIRKQGDDSIIKSTVKKTPIEEPKKVITESLFLTRQKYFKSGIPPTQVEGNAKNGLKGVLNTHQGTKEVQSHDAKAGQGLKPGDRSIQEATLFGHAKPFKIRPTGAVIEARNEKNALLKQPKDLPSAFSTLRDNPTRVAKPGHKVNRDLMGQTNQNGEGVA